MGKRALLTSLCLALGLAVFSVPALAQADPRVITGFGSVVAVKDPADPSFPEASIMRVDCAVLVRLEADDGSATEWMACDLSDEPVMIPERQGTPPETTLTYGGGECLWSSDYWFNVNDTEVKASGFEVTVTSNGRVFAWASFPAEVLECPEDAGPPSPEESAPPA
jgi:hypothetical protein